MEPIADIHADLLGRLRRRQGEIEQATLTQVRELAGVSDTGEPGYLESLHEAVSAALDYGIASIGQVDRGPPPVPTVLYAQARLAARSGVELETVIRRYVAGYTQFGNFLMEEAEAGGFLGTELRSLRQALAAVFSHMLGRISAEYTHEREVTASGAEKRRVERVKRLLAGETIDASGLAYDFNLNHLGLIALGSEASHALHELARQLDQRLLTLRLGERTHWAWLGSKNEKSTLERQLLISRHWPSHLPLSVGAPLPGIDGWRLTHRQANAALGLALHGDVKQVYYADVAVVASLKNDELLTRSLSEIYLEPLSHDRDGGKVLRETLRAYFDADRGVLSTAAALGVSRQTVTNRLRTVEARLGRPIGACSLELDVALRLQDLA